MRVQLNTIKRGERFKLINKANAPLWVKFGMYDKRNAIIVRNGETPLDFDAITRTVAFNRFVYV